MSVKSQSALEYMMTYGWAILVIVIVAAVLYSLGIFSPSSSISSTITGFAGLGSVSAQCFPGGGLVLSLSDSMGVPIQITKINTTNQNGKPVSVNFSSIISPSGSSYFVVADSCSNASGTSYSNKVSVTYTEPGQPLPGPYISSGDIMGHVMSAGLAASFSGSGYIEQSTGFKYMSNPSQPFTISIWVNPSSSSGVIVDELGQPQPNSNWHDSWIELVNGMVYIRVWSLECVKVSTIPLNQWSNIVMTGSISGSTITYSGYINGVFYNSSSGSRSAPGGNVAMFYPLGTSDGTNCGSGAYFSGKMSDYQVYNFSMSAHQVAQVYKNGLAGAPISNEGLTLWLPLDGNANDYSGNNNNGVTTNVNWVSP